MAEADQPSSGVPFTLDGRAVEARPGELVIEAAERHGTYIPRFCYHPRMRPVGMCRMCIVEIDTGRGPALQPACMLECTPDMKVDTTSPVTTKAQDGVLEFLLINHPLDCPVCDKGGECPLQDQTMAYGPGESRFVEEKRHFEKPIAISDLVYLDRERCILCDRCTRFAKEVAGDPLISFIDRGNQTQVNTFPDDPFASYFSGNTVQICPVGALTATPYRFRARPWDLEEAESTCQTCSVGCRISVQTSRNRVLRYQGVDVDPVNWGWLCDKGRFGFEAMVSDDRLDQPLRRDPNDVLVPVPWSEALGAAAAALRSALDQGGPESIAVVGGARLTNEDAYAWAKLAKGVIGTDNVDCQLGDGLTPEAVLGLPSATIDEVCEPGGVVLLLGADPKEELPVLYLRLRHAVTEDGATLVEITPEATSLSPLATVSLRPRPGEVGDVVRAITDGRFGEDVGGVAANELVAAAALLGSERLRVVLGRASVAETADAVVDAAAALLGRAGDVAFLPAVRRGNVRGALDLGLAPGLLPGRVTLDAGREWFESAWPTVPAATGLDTTGILEAAAEGRIRTLVLLGADVLVDFPDRDLARRALSQIEQVVMLDLFATETAAYADVVLPVAGFGECEGTTTNLEGRVTTLSQRMTPPGTARSDWMIAAELAFRLGADLGLESPEDIWDEIESMSSTHRHVTSAVLRSSLGREGVVVPVGDAATLATSVNRVVDLDGVPVELKFRSRTGLAELAPDEPSSDVPQGPDGGTDDGDGEPRTDVTDVDAGPSRPATVRFDPDRPAFAPPPRDAYALRLVSSRRLYDLGTTVQRSPSLAGLPPGAELRLNGYDFDRLGVAEGDEVRVSSVRGELRAAIYADPGVPRGAAAIPFNQPGLSAAELIDATGPVTDVHVETADG